MAAAFPFCSENSPMVSLRANRTGLVLRKHNSNRENSDQKDHIYYKLIGECYVHGMMDGEAFTYKPKSRTPEQAFELR